MMEFFAAIGMGVCIGFFSVLILFEFFRGVEFFKDKWKSRKSRNVEDTR